MPTLVEMQHLKKYFTTPRGVVHAVDDVSMKVEKGNTMGIVGESGCGKTTLGRVLINMDRATGGRIFFDGKDVTHLSQKEKRAFHERAQFIFQDPYSSLNPRMTVEETISEPFRYVSTRLNRKEIVNKTIHLMGMVGIAQRIRSSYPHELDGGRRQRVVIARALALEPEFIVCDEPVSALDVSIQAQILNLLQDLQEEQHLTFIFITHDMSVVRHISDNISVMYLGQVVETSPAKELFIKTWHPYTKALLSAIPTANIHSHKERILLKGEITSPIDPKPGCRFAARCNYAGEKCRDAQILEEVAENHFVSCCRVHEINNLKEKKDGN
ncbi:ABC transporter ATP-binding protein [Spirochaetia bacterium]|nr:ABC transporter ATP-binding protein [Spirochaetia bacterium]GHV68720.1 ABC transporter ATP-binding protein [Spirochaetia bacterium]